MAEKGFDSFARSLADERERNGTCLGRIEAIILEGRVPGSYCKYSSRVACEHRGEKEIFVNEAPRSPVETKCICKYERKPTDKGMQPQ